MRLVFHVAVNSDGNQWSTSMISFTLTNGRGTVPVNFNASDPVFPQYFSLNIKSVEDEHAGVYTASAPGK